MGELAREGICCWEEVVAICDTVCFFWDWWWNHVLSAKCGLSHYSSGISGIGPVFMVTAREISTQEWTVHQCCYMVSDCIVYPSLCILFVIIVSVYLFPFAVLLSCFYPDPQSLLLDSPPHLIRVVGRGEQAARISSCWLGLKPDTVHCRT